MDMEENNPVRDKISGHLYLFCISFLSLFLELALIRWLGVEIRILAYFRNLVLVSCFLGLGIGFSLKKYRMGLLTSVALVAVLAVLVHPRFQPFGVSLRNISNYLTVFPEFHMWAAFDRYKVSLPELILGLAGGFLMVSVVVVMLAAIFIPFGQILGDIFEASDNRIRDYSINLLGSLIGVWAFAMISYLWTPPWVWFLVGVGGSVFFIRPRRSWKLIVGIFLMVATLFFTMEKEKENTVIHWSPYQKIQFTKHTHEIENLGKKIPYYSIKVNSVFYMFIFDISRSMADRYPGVFEKSEAPYYPYDLPYRFQPKLDNVLIVGAGGGNDVAAALRNGAKHVDAVEIDPAIARLGIEHHQERPYHDPRVNLIIDDARSFFKKTDKKYDMINFGLLDSHTLTSNFTNINLDSYVYTRESFREVKAHMAEGGVIVIKFQVSRMWLGLKIWELIKEEFEQEPLILLPVDDNLLHGTGGTIFLIGDQDKIRQRIEKDPQLKERVSEFVIPTESFEKFAEHTEFDIPEDDWPYLYLQKRQLPNLHLVMIIIMAVLMRFSIRYLFPGGKIGPSHFLFLGAGFMLVEVHSISKVALLFGSTWIVNVVIISAILTMILAANMIALKYNVERVRWWYVGLFITLALSYIVPVQELIVGGYLVRGIVAGVFYSCPMFFAGVIFASSIRRVLGVEAAFASNMLGAAVGGMLESTSYIFGLKAVVIVALLLYIVSAVTLRRMPLITPPA